MLEYFYAERFKTDSGFHYNLRKASESGSQHISYLIKTEEKDVVRIVNLMNESCRFHLPSGVQPITIRN